MRLKNNNLKADAWPYIFTAPYFIVYFLFGLFPILYTFFISLTDWSGLGEKNFIGFKNYINLFTTDPYFYKSISNTMLIMAGFIPLCVIVGLLLAVGLYSKIVKGKRLFQFANFLPYVTTPVAIGLMFQLIFDYNIGIVNRVLLALGAVQEGVYWLGDSLHTQFIVIFIIFWKYAGYHMMIYMAGLAGIPTELYEAATVDGAKPWMVFRKITVPLLAPVTLFLVITDIISGFQLFDEPLILLTNTAGGAGTPGGPGRSCLTAVWNMYDTAFGSTMRYGLGSAIAYSTFIFILFFSIIGFKVFKRGDNEL